MNSKCTNILFGITWHIYYPLFPQFWHTIVFSPTHGNLHTFTPFARHAHTAHELPTTAIQ